MRKQPIVLALALAATLAACGDASDDERLEPVDETAEAPAPSTTPPPAAPAGAGEYDEAALPEGVTLAMVQEGEQLWSGGPCVACHSANAEGGPLAPNLTDDEWLNVEGGTYDGIVQVITDGVATPVQYPGLMPPMGGGSYTDAQVRALAAYVYMLRHRA